jgi:hypothetical protein
MPLESRESLPSVFLLVWRLGECRVRIYAGQVLNGLHPEGPGVVVLAVKWPVRRGVLCHDLLPGQGDRCLGVFLAVQPVCVFPTVDAEVVVKV